MCALRERFGLAIRVLVLIAALGLGMGAALAFAELDPSPPAEVGVLKSEVEKMKTVLDSITKELEILKPRVSQRPLPSATTAGGRGPRRHLWEPHVGEPGG